MKAQLTTAPISEETALPTELNSPQAKLVYLYLEAADGATVSEVSDALSMKKMTTLSVTNSLSTQGLIEKIDNEYVTVR
ncbi:hypothetical protein HALLA_06155 [Halostagnicola larsenii XH-48]|uniref:MarR family transcriptional regulator n=1 Tax=Halostagnicola larsenii XH-48 TaxID=797299 RepID=W0JMU3_9EURY|nr:helix-turn-helix domain-containing protein [Halostagnicola larsenii]AHF98489.1 hypothetical protein HALLA_06155 [Halostagnicola larsenii XH-48]